MFSSISAPGLRKLSVIPALAAALFLTSASALASKKAAATVSGRAIHPNPECQLPDAGDAFYVFTGSALTRSQVRAFASAGLAYLGVIARNGYVFVRSRSEPGQEAFIAAQPNISGTATLLPQDRVSEDLRAYIASGGTNATGISVSFWSQAQRSAVIKANPSIAGIVSASGGSVGIIGEDSIVRLGGPLAPQAIIDELSNSPYVAALDIDLERQVFNESSRDLSNADAIEAAPFGLTGQGVVIGHWDGGSVDANHPDFGNRVNNRENSDVNFHATHTAGTILGNGSGNQNARGYAPNATMVAFDFFGNVGEQRRETKHDFYHEHDNHSYGIDVQRAGITYGGYNGDAREFDVDARDLLLIGVKSAGNDGEFSEVTDNGRGFDSLGPDSTSKNNLIVAATQDNGNLANFSSRGPTNDGRIKPDISANGVQLLSALPGGGYASISGTSMSAPSVTGALALLSELYTSRFGVRWAPDDIRSIIFQTANDVDAPGPDYHHGWGQIDALAAAQLIAAEAENPGTRIVRGALRDGEETTYAIDIQDGTPELKVTVNWLDGAINGNGRERVINDLDATLVSPSGETFFPWSLNANAPANNATRTASNDIDNVEQILVNGPQSGTWTLRIRADSISDPNLPVQGFVIATSQRINRRVVRFSDATDIDIPDNDNEGATVTFSTAVPMTVEALRVRLEIKHEARGNLRIVLQAPNGNTATLESEDQSNRRDIYAVYPDLRSYDEDVTTLYGEQPAGEWKIIVSDRAQQNVGTILTAQFELEAEDIIVIPNEAPTANAGPNRQVSIGATVGLDGSLSADPDGTIEAFAWTQVAGPSVELKDDDSATPNFIAPEVTDDTDFDFRLQVTDNGGATDTDDLRIRVLATVPPPPNRGPTAVAGGDGEVAAGQVFTMHASDSTDPDADALRYRWQQLSGAIVGLPDPTAETVRATAPATAGTVVFQLEVTDPSGAIDLAAHVLTVTAPIVPPTPPAPRPTPPGGGDDEDPTVIRTGDCACIGLSGSAEWPALLPFMAFAGLLVTRRRRHSK